MAADSTKPNSIKLTLLAQSDETGRMTYFAGEGIPSEIEIDRVRGVTVYFGPSHTPSLAQTASLVTLIPQTNSGGAASVFQLYVRETKDCILTAIHDIKLNKGYGIMAARRPMQVEPMALKALTSPQPSRPSAAPTRVLATTSGRF